MIASSTPGWIFSMMVPLREHACQSYHRPDGVHYGSVFSKGIGMGRMGGTTFFQQLSQNSNECSHE